MFSRAGQGLVGSRFEAALKDELSRSTRYKPRYSEGVKTKFEFHIDLRTADVSDNKSEQGKRSVISVVIEDFGLPNRTIQVDRRLSPSRGNLLSTWWKDFEQCLCCARTGDGASDDEQDGSACQ